MIAPALTSISQGLQIEADSVLLLVSAMFLASSVGQPIAGRLADRIGPRRVFVAGMGIISAAGVLGAVAASLGGLATSRLLIGIGTGAAYPAAIALIARRYQGTDERAATSNLGMVTTAGLIGLALGPPLGGLLVEFVGWRAVFAINVPLALGPLLLALRWLPRDKPRPHVERRPLDVWGMFLFAAVISSLVLLTETSQFRWFYAAAFLVFTGLLVAWERRFRDPFFDLRMFGRAPALTFAYLRIILTFVIVYGVMFGLTQWVTQIRELSPLASSVLLLLMSATGAVASAIGSRRGSVQGLLLVGTASLVCGILLLFGVDSSSGVLVLAVAYILFGVPTGLNMLANHRVAILQNANTDQVGVVSGLARTSQYLGGIAATGVIGFSYATAGGDEGLQILAGIFAAIGIVLLGERIPYSSLYRRLHGDV